MSTTIQDENAKIQRYIQKMVPGYELLSRCLRQQKFNKEEKEEEPSWIKKPHAQNVPPTD